MSGANVTGWVNVKPSSEPSLSNTDVLLDLAWIVDGGESGEYTYSAVFDQARSRLTLTAQHQAGGSRSFTITADDVREATSS